MYSHFLVPTDGSALSNKAVKEAVALAKLTGAKITLLHVVEQYHMPVADEGFTIPEIPELKKRHDEAARKAAHHIMATAKRTVAEAGVPCEEAVSVEDTPYDAILKQAKQSKCDLIVMASHGRRGLEALLLGSETTRVLTHSTIPVLVCR